MKFTVEVEEFWLDEDSDGFDLELKESIKRKVVDEIKSEMSGRIKSEISEVVKSLIEKELTSIIKDEVISAVNEGVVVNGRYGEATPIKEYLKTKFTDDRFKSTLNNHIEDLSKNFANELKRRYDLVFATQIVEKISDNGLLREDIKYILEQKNEK